MEVKSVSSRNKIVNVSKDDYFDSFVSIGNISNNALSFLYDNEKLGDNLPLKSGVICTEKTANKLNSNQKIFIVSNVQESVAVISNIFYRDYDEKEKINFDDISSSIVTIESINNRGKSFGSGVIISHDVYIITAFHNLS